MLGQFNSCFSKIHGVETEDSNVERRNLYHQGSGMSSKFVDADWVVPLIIDNGTLGMSSYLMMDQYRGILGSKTQLLCVCNGWTLKPYRYIIKLY